VTRFVFYYWFVSPNQTLTSLTWHDRGDIGMIGIRVYMLPSVRSLHLSGRGHLIVYLFVCKTKPNCNFLTATLVNKICCCCVMVNLPINNQTVVSAFCSGVPQWAIRCVDSGCGLWLRDWFSAATVGCNSGCCYYACWCCHACCCSVFVANASAGMIRR